MGITELAVLKWLHILSMVYWLGGEWGVFQTSYNVINRALSMEERHRHLETLYRIDILARTGIILLLPLGMHMGYIWGVQPYGGNFLIVMWALVALWLGLCWIRCCCSLRESLQLGKLSPCEATVTSVFNAAVPLTSSSRLFVLVVFSCPSCRSPWTALPFAAAAALLQL